MSDTSKVIDKINRCHNYQTVFAMEADFNSVGLTIQRTAKNWMILCTIVDNKPVALEVLNDFVFLAMIEDQGSEVPERAISCISDFVQENASKASEVKDIARVWRNGVRTYGKYVTVNDEDVQSIAQDMEEDAVEESKTDEEEVTELIKQSIEDSQKPIEEMSDQELQDMVTGFEPQRFSKQIKKAIKRVNTDDIQSIAQDVDE